MKNIVIVIFILFFLILIPMFYYYLNNKEVDIVLNKSVIKEVETDIDNKNKDELKKIVDKLYSENEKDKKNINIYIDNKEEVEKLNIEKKDEFRESTSIAYSKSKFQNFEKYVNMLDPLWDVVQDKKSTPQQKSVAIRKIAMFYWENNRNPDTLQYIFKNGFEKYYVKNNIDESEKNILEFANSIHEDHLATLYIAFIKARKLATAKFLGDKVFLSKNTKTYIGEINAGLKRTDELLIGVYNIPRVYYFKYKNLKLLTEGLLNYVGDLKYPYKEGYIEFIKLLKGQFEKTRHASTFIPGIEYFYLAISDLNNSPVKNEKEIINEINKFGLVNPHLKLIIEQINKNKVNGRKLDIIDYMFLNERLNKQLKININYETNNKK